MTDHTNAYNNFTKFEFEMYARKRNSCHSAKFDGKNRKMTQGELFLVGFSHLEPLCGLGTAAKVFYYNT